VFFKAHLSGKPFQRCDTSQHMRRELFPLKVDRATRSNQLFQLCMNSPQIDKLRGNHYKSLDCFSILELRHNDTFSYGSLNNCSWTALVLLFYRLLNYGNRINLVAPICDINSRRWPQTCHHKKFRSNYWHSINFSCLMSFSYRRKLFS
jgi:hypothetical protein